MQRHSIWSRLCQWGLALLAACGVDLTPPPDPVPEVPGPIVSVDQGAYSWDADSAVTATVINPDDAPVFYRACFTYRLEFYRDGWRDSPLPEGVFLSTSACAVRRLTATGSAGRSLRLTNDVFPKSGWYRVVFDAYRDSTVQIAWDKRSRVSPAFQVTP